MSVQSQQHRTFQNADLHEKWESVYRGNPLQKSLDDTIMDRLVSQLDIPPGSRILDAGCGTGEHSVRLCKRGFFCVGVDISTYVVQKAKERAAQHGLAQQGTFVCASLDDLPFDDGHFHAIHCRGVLMHIPRWQDALRELCRLLRPGGSIVILESNHKAIEMLIVRLARLFRENDSKMVKSVDGLEMWQEKDDEAPLTRFANIPRLVAELDAHQIDIAGRFATHFWDINRFPAGVWRNMVIRYNRLYFALRFPAVFSSGNAIVGRKR